MADNVIQGFPITGAASTTVGTTATATTTTTTGIARESTVALSVMAPSTSRLTPDDEAVDWMLDAERSLKKQTIDNLGGDDNAKNKVNSKGVCAAYAKQQNKAIEVVSLSFCWCFSS